MTNTQVRAHRAYRLERVSTEEQSAARQAAANARAVASLGLIDWRTYDKDSGISASRFARKDRPDHEALVRDLSTEARPGDYLVTSEVSRTDRRTARWAALVEVCAERHVLIHLSLKSRTYDPSVWDDRETLLRMGIAAEGEVEGLSARIRDGKAYWASQGNPVGGRAHYGIKRINDPDRTRNRWIRDEPHPVTGAHAVRILREAGQGKAWTHMIRDLQADGIAPSRNAAAWSITALTGIARRSAVYLALGMITADEHHACQARVTRRTGERPARQVHRYSFTLACHACGSLCRGVNDRYRCPFGHTSIKITEVDPWIDALAVARLTRPDLINAMSPDTAENARQARTEAAAWRARVASAREDCASGAIDLDDFKAITAPWKASAAACDARAETLETPQALAGLAGEDADMVRAGWDALPASARRAAMRALAPHAVLRAGTRGHGTGAPGRHGGGTPVHDRVILWP